MDLTGLGSIFDFGGKLIDKLIPDKGEALKMKVKMLELQQAGEFKELDAEVALAKGQTDINLQEAKHESVFVSGWRPGLGWTFVATIATNYMFVPMLAWVSPLLDMPPPSRLDLGELMPILVGILGLGGMRTHEKVKGVAGK